MTETIYMRHPDSGPIVPTTQDAYDALWSDKGWQLVSAETAEATESDTPDWRSMTKAELVEQVRLAGLNPDASMTKAELVGVLESNSTFYSPLSTVEGTDSGDEDVAAELPSPSPVPVPQVAPVTEP